MKLRFLASVCCAAALAACDQVKEIPNPLGGNKGGAETASPTATIDAYKAAIASQDWQKMYGLLSAEFQKQALAEVEELKRDLAGGDADKKKAAVRRIQDRGMKPEQFAQGDAAKLAAEWVGMEAMKGSARLPKVIKETKSIKLDGAKASVEYFDPEWKSGTIRFVKENAMWRFAP
ncbi:MAG: hypothetical protein FD180_2998 [Planctomycetota bacterium]|nr:MAG: hypothetical protein FD180_2998 [Planctomycetota bacterium]